MLRYSKYSLLFSLNIRCLYLFPQDVSDIDENHICRLHHSAWSVISDGVVMLPFIFPYGPTLNKEAYIKYLEEVLLSWTEMVAAVRLCYEQQDSALYHTRTLCWLSKYFCNHITRKIWLPNYPDCNPLRRVRLINKTPCNTKDEVMARIRAP